MILNGYFGNPSTWALIAGAWIGLSLIVGLLVGVLARVEDRVAERRERRERREGK